MAKTDGTTDAAPKKKGKLGLMIGLALMLLGGGGGFYAVQAGLILGGSGAATAAAGTTAASAPKPLTEAGRDGGAAVVFLPVDPLVISLAGPARGRHLRFRAELEVAATQSKEVAHLMPRVVDVMNGYLRAVDPAALEAPGALTALRAQLLRRVELVVGPGRVADVLVMEFVLS